MLRCHKKEPSALQRCSSLKSCKILTSASWRRLLFSFIIYLFVHSNLLFFHLHESAQAAFARSDFAAARRLGPDRHELHVVFLLLLLRLLPHFLLFLHLDFDSLTPPALRQMCPRLQDVVGNRNEKRCALRLGCSCCS